MVAKRIICSMGDETSMEQVAGDRYFAKRADKRLTAQLRSGVLATIGSEWQPRAGFA